VSTDTAPSHSAPTEHFRHEALLYDGFDEFVAASGSFLRAGIDAGEPTLAVLEPRKIDALRAALGGTAEDVEFADMTEVGANPARIMPIWREFVGRHPGRRLRGVGEPVSPDRSPPELVECHRHESLLNLAFAATTGFYLLCPYDASALDPGTLEAARRSHPYLAGTGAEGETSDYRGLQEAVAPFSQALPDPPTEPDSRVFQMGTLGAMRDFVARLAERRGLSDRKAADLVLAVNEVATNSVQHGGGGGLLRVWPEEDALICEVSDRGLIREPLVGRELPILEQGGGHGLWLANQLCDLVQIRTFANGSVVRVHQRR
jgi:anti-sigma regulatory factor (Ser/Thr protein kinase)